MAIGKLLERLNNGLSQLEACRNLDPVDVCVSVTYKFDVIDYFDGVAKVPIGVKANPVGISVSKSDYVVFRGHDGNKNHIIQMDTLKNWARKNASTIEKTIDENFKHMVLVVKIKDIEDLCEYD